MANVQRKLMKPCRITKVFGGVPDRETLVLSSNHRLFRYSISVTYVFKAPDNSEVAIEFSNSKMKNANNLEVDKKRSERVYKMAVFEFDELSRGGWFIYDRQSTLYSTSMLPNEKLTFTVDRGVSRRANFVKAHFVLERNKDSFEVPLEKVPEIAKTLPPLKKIIEIGNCLHYTTSR